MSSRIHRGRTSPRVRLVGMFAAPALAALLVAACGGGGYGGSGGTYTPPPTQSPSAATAWADGPISGFGSVIVNGVRFDDTAADVSDDEGRHLAVDDLRLGMSVEVEGEAGDDAAHATAHGLHVHAAVVGPVQAVDATAGTLTVLGQSVTVDASTLIDDSLAGGLAGVAPGMILRVYGAAGVDGSLRATRLEDAGAVTAFRVRGAVASIDGAAHTLVIGGATIDTTTVGALPAGVAVGVVVVAVVDTTPLAGGAWPATAIVRATRHFEGDHDEAQADGLVTSFTSSTSFEVDGLPVDATGASFPDGATGLAEGVHVEVEGTLKSGTLVATVVRLEDAHRGQGEDVELHGTISALDTGAGTFVLRGSVVRYTGPDVAFDHGSASTLANGVHVEVHGDLDTDGRTVQATRIDFTDD